MSRSTNKEKDGISIADLISIIAVVALGLLTGLSVAFITFNLLTAVIAGAGIAILTGILLSLAVKFKKRDSAVKNWRVAEYVCVFLLFLLFVASIFLIGHYMAIQQEKDSLRSKALDDIEAIANGVADFQHSEEEALGITTLGLTDAMTSIGSTKSVELLDFIDNNSINNVSRIDEYKLDQMNLISKLLLKENAVSYDERWKGMLADSKSAIEGWNVFKLPVGIARMEEVNNEAKEVIPKLADQLVYPTITRDNSIYLITDALPKPAPYNVNLGFRTKLADTGYFNLAGLGIAVLIFIGVLFSYFSASRSRRTGIARDKRDDIGQIL